MADFCNKCTERMFGENVEPDIDVYKIGENLEPGYFQVVLCEGCGLKIISKNELGYIKVGGDGEMNEDGFVKLMSYEEYIENYSGV